MLASLKMCLDSFETSAFDFLHSEPGKQPRARIATGRRRRRTRRLCRGWPRQALALQESRISSRRQSGSGKLQNIYLPLLSHHNVVRWLALAAALVAIVVAFFGWSGAKPAGASLRRFSLLFVIVMDIEFLIGLLLYFGASPITRAALATFGEAMKHHESRFLTVEHVTLMFLAVVCAHVGAALARQARTDLMKYRGPAIGYSISLLLMLAGIPWWRPLLRL